MQKVVCPYCGRVAKYVDSSVIYYGHSYGMAYASPSNQGVRCRLVNFTILDGKEEKNLPRIGSWRSDDI